MSEQLSHTLYMFFYLGIELSALFLLISFFVGMLQRHIPEKTIEKVLSGNRRSGYLIAAGLGAITPFCSCSTIPMLKGLIRAKAGFGPMMVFLFSSPLLNPVIVGLLVATFGWKLTFVYVAAALGVAVIAGWLLQTLKFYRFIRQDEVNNTSSCSATNSDCGSQAETAPSSTCGTANTCSATATVKPQGRYAGLWQETWKDFLKVLPYLLIGIVIGSVIYGFMPTEILIKYTGADNPFAIPVAAIIGVPLYIRAEAVIPLAGMLMAKGAGAGTVLALIIGSAGASITEVILLRSLFTDKLIAAFLVVIFTMAVFAGYVTNLLY